MRISPAVRAAAATACIAAIAVGVGAKASVASLAAMTLAVLFALHTTFDWKAQRHQPHRAIVGVLVLLLWAAVSASWGQNPGQGLRSALALAAIIVIGELLGRLLERLNTVDAELIAGWFCIGLAIGSIWLLCEIVSDFAFQRALFNHFPFMRPTVNNMLVIDNGRVVGVNSSHANWSVAGVNIVLWPALLIMTNIAGAGFGHLVTFTLYALVCTVTWNSEHQTSMLGIATATVTFALALVSPTIVDRLARAGFAAIVLGIVPLAYLMYSVFQWHQASWMHPSMLGRIEIWGGISARVLDAPLFGAGSVSQGLMGYHPHNFYMQIWHELGAVGAGLTLWAGVTGIRAISQMELRVRPYAYAMAATAVIETLATWNLWHAWVTGALVLSLNLMRLAAGIARTRPAHCPKFHETWLAPEVRTAVQRNRRILALAAVLAALLSVMV